MPLYDVRWLGDDEFGEADWDISEFQSTKVEAISPRGAVEAWLKMYNRREAWGVNPPDVFAVRPAQTAEWRFTADEQGSIREHKRITQVEVAE